MVIHVILQVEFVLVKFCICVLYHQIYIRSILARIGLQNLFPKIMYFIVVIDILAVFIAGTVYLVFVGWYRNK